MAVKENKEYYYTVSTLQNQYNIKTDMDYKSFSQALKESSGFKIEFTRDEILDERAIFTNSLEVQPTNKAGLSENKRIWILKEFV